MGLDSTAYSIIPKLLIDAATKRIFFTKFPQVQALTAIGSRYLLTLRLMTFCKAVNEELVKRFARWLVVQEYAACTRYRYPRTIRVFSNYLNQKSFQKVTHLDIQEFLAESAAKGNTPKYIRGELYALRVFFDFLNIGGLIKWVPPRMVKLRPMRRHIPKILTKEQVGKMLGAVATRHEKALIEVLYGTGCRTGEIRSMRIENIDFEERRIRVRGKTGNRFVMFTPTAAKALRDYVKGRKEGYVFVVQRAFQRICPQRTPKGQWRCRWKVYDEKGHYVMSKEGFIGAGENRTYRQALTHFSELAKNDRLKRPVGLRPLSRAAIQKAVQKVGFRVGLRVNPCYFRHSFATHLLDNGADLRVIQELMGHNSIRSTQVYTHVSKKQIQRAFDQCHPRSNLTH